MPTGTPGVLRGRIDGAAGAGKPGGAAGSPVKGSPHGDGPGATGAERGRAGDADPAGWSITGGS